MSSDTDRTAADAPSALPPGTRLGEFEVLRVLGVGGFGIVYLAMDHALEREVAVKEYMPSALAGRTATMHVSLRSQGDADTFALGLKSFVNEARLLARFDHPSLLKVHRFWEANGTAYMAMPVYRGRTLKDVRAAMANPPDEAWLRALLDPLLGAIGTLHDAGVFHRDIAPDNIVIEGDGHPVLLDFGAARKVISDKSQTLTAILKPAYAPIEQYGDTGAVKQGPWTDLYALGATLHYLLLGRPPTPATARVVHDDQPALAGAGLPGCSVPFLQALDWMLAPRPADRPQSVAALRDALEGRAAAPVRAAPAPEASPVTWERTQNFPSTVGRTQPPQDDAATVIRPPAPKAAPVPPPPAPPPAPKAAPVPPPAPAAAPAASKAPVIAVVAVVAIAAGAFVFWPRSGSAPATPAAAVPAPAPMEPPGPLASAPVPAPAPAPVAEPAPPPVATSPAPAPAPVPTVVATPQSKPPAPTPAKAPPPVAAKPAPAVVEAAPPPPPPAPAPVVPAPRPPVAKTEPPPPAPAPAPEVVAGPRQRCGSRVLVALSICMERECKKAELTQHPECVKWRDELQKLANPGG